MTTEQVKEWLTSEANKQLPQYIDVQGEYDLIQSHERQKCNHFTVQEMRYLMERGGMPLYAALVQGMHTWLNSTKQDLMNWHHNSDEFLLKAIDYRKYSYTKAKNSGRISSLQMILNEQYDDLWRCGNDQEQDAKILDCLDHCEKLIGRWETVFGPDGHKTDDPLALIFHRAKDNPIEAICIKDNPPMNGFGRELKQGDKVTVSGLIHDPMIGNFAIKVAEETAFYQYDYFAQVKT